MPTVWAGVRDESIAAATAAGVTVAPLAGMRGVSPPASAEAARASTQAADLVAVCTGVPAVAIGATRAGVWPGGVGVKNTSGCGLAGTPCSSMSSYSEWMNIDDEEEGGRREGDESKCIKFSRILIVIKN